MKRGLGWPVGIVACLGVSVIANIAFMVVANNDPAFAVEPDFYRKAVAFDSSMARERASNALGWHLEVQVAAIVANQDTELRVTVRDAAGVPVRFADVRVTAMHNARSGVRLESLLQADSARGYYGATLAIHRPGLWEIRCEVTRGAEHFVVTQRVDVVGESIASASVP